MLLVDTLFDSIELTGSHTNLFILASGHESHMTQFGWLLNINCIATNQGWSHDLELGGKHINNFFFLETPNKYSFRKLSLFVCFFFFFFLSVLLFSHLDPFYIFFQVSCMLSNVCGCSLRLVRIDLGIFYFIFCLCLAWVCFGMLFGLKFVIGKFCS